MENHTIILEMNYLLNLDWIMFKCKNHEAIFDGAISIFQMLDERAKESIHDKVTFLRQEWIISHFIEVWKQRLWECVAFLR